MNLDPNRYCYTCQLPKPKEGFRALQGVVPKREVCADCFAKINRIKAAKGPEIIR